MVEDSRAGVEDGAEGVVIALEVGDEHLNRAAGQHVADALDALGEDGRAAVRQVLSGDGGDDAVAQLKLPDGLGEASRLLGVEGQRAAGGHGAVVATPSADVAENHEGGGAALPTIADIGALGLLAHGVQALVAHEVAQAQVVWATRGGYPEPVRQSTFRGHGHLLCVLSSS